MAGYIEPEDAIMEDTFQEVTKPKRVLQVVIDDDHPFDLEPYIGAYSGIHSASFYPSTTAKLTSNNPCDRPCGNNSIAVHRPSSPLTHHPSAYPRFTLCQDRS